MYFVTHWHRWSFHPNLQVSSEDLRKRKKILFISDYILSNADRNTKHIPNLVLLLPICDRKSSTTIQRAKKSLSSSTENSAAVCLWVFIHFPHTVVVFLQFDFLFVLFFKVLLEAFEGAIFLFQLLQEAVGIFLALLQLFLEICLIKCLILMPNGWICVRSSYVCAEKTRVSPSHLVLTVQHSFSSSICCFKSERRFKLT